jgi:hypothetical protein
MEFRNKRPDKSADSPRKKRRTLEKHDGFKKFEKILCYEPDVTKVKVLYDAKVSEILCLFLNFLRLWITTCFSDHGYLRK